MTSITCSPGRLVAALVALVLPLALVAGPARADGPAPEPDPVRGLVLPLEDGIISLLGPLPSPHRPYEGETCPDGDVACIDAVIAEMQQRLEGYAASCHHRAIFSLAYLRVTENVRGAVADGYFDDPVWLNRLDAVFAELYFDVIDDWEAGRRDGVPAAWRIALQAEDDQAMTGLGNFLLAMNAHINRDFPHVLAEVGLTAADGTSHKPDHNAYNQRLDSLYDVVFPEAAARFDPTFDDIDVGTLEETVAGTTMRGWREMVWRHAELLASARTPAARRLVAGEIEAYAATQARLIRGTFTAGERQRTARNAWCAEHGRG